MVIATALKRVELAIRRAEAVLARSDTRAWVMQRRERTRHLIELGGLVQKAELVALMHDDRAALYGSLLELADRLGGDEAAGLVDLYRRRGRRAFEAEAASPEGDP